MSLVSNLGNGIWIIGGDTHTARSRACQIRPAANILKHLKHLFPPKSLVLGQMFHDIRVPVICSCDLTLPNKVTLPVCMGSKFNKSTTVPQFHVVKFWLLSVLLSLLLPLLFFCTRGRTSMLRNPRSCAASAGWAHRAACQSATNVLTAGFF